MSRLELDPLTSREAECWDELIAPYASRSLFHKSVWLDYLAASHGIRVRLWRIHNGRETLGYFCGGIVRKGPFKVLGSPLRGWNTSFMGPIANAGFNGRAFLRALDDVAAREGLAMVEIESPLLSDCHFSEFRYKSMVQPNITVEITPRDLEGMWNRMDSRARTKVRKAKKYGLTVEDTNDPGIVDEFYDQLTEALARKHDAPAYDRKCPRLLFDLLKPRDLLFALQVRTPKREIVATALYPHDERAVYGWARSCRTAAWGYCPNDFLQWSVLELAAQRGLHLYNTCTYGSFFSKFGGSEQITKRWHKCYWCSARWARRGYELYSQKRMRLQAWWYAVRQHICDATIYAPGAGTAGQTMRLLRRDPERRP